MSTFCICRSTGHLWMPEKSYVYSLLYNLLSFGQPVWILHNQQSIYVNTSAESGPHIPYLHTINIRPSEANQKTIFWINFSEQIQQPIRWQSKITCFCFIFSFLSEKTYFFYPASYYWYIENVTPRHPILTSFSFQFIILLN